MFNNRFELIVDSSDQFIRSHITLNFKLRQESPDFDVALINGFFS